MQATNTLSERLKRASSSRGPGPTNYQVFLSFRGPDTRQGFVDCLYHFMIDAGIRVFKDAEDNPLGEKIEKIVEAVANSKICIPVFSRGYASSRWCLRELVKMIELDKTIIPIFYDVTPDDVTLKTSLYVDALEALHVKMERRDFTCDGKCKSHEEIEQWKKALQEVGTSTGRELKDAGHGEFCKSIVKEVSNVLKKNEKIVTDHLVGMDAYVETMLNILDVEAHDVRFVGIHGMGGVGKTTLAKVIFNHLCHHFEYCSFLSDTRELSQRNGILCLQKQLLNDLRCKSRDISDCDEGIKMIMATSSNKKVLIVLDDVNQKEQIDKLAGDSSWFATGSRIIVTSRDKRVLAFEEKSQEGTSDTSQEISTIEMQEMDFGKALQLFSRHAFSTDSPPQEYVDLAKEAVYVSRYLPLSLEVIGSLLRNKHIDDWKEKIKALRIVPHENVRQRLKISYEALDQRTQQMFLDIACFLVNTDKTHAMYMWESCNFHPGIGIEELISMSLVKIVNNKFWMHDHLRDLGRDIVYLENVLNPRKRSRLWKYEEALGMLERREGNEKVEALCLPKPCDIPFTHPNIKILIRFLKKLLCSIYIPGTHLEFTDMSFKNLRNLRFLELWVNKEGDKFNLTGDFTGLLANLRWFSWHDCPSHLKSKNLNLVNLVVLDLSHSEVTEGWNGWSKIKIGNNLKVLDLSYCKSLVTTPDLSKYHSLEKLILEGCTHLIQIDSSVGTLKNLKHLNVKQCLSLHVLPEALCCLGSLEEILVQGHHQSFTLPREIGNLKSLVNLELVDTGITDVPASICQLEKLKRLSFQGCRGIDKLSDSLGDLKALVELDISDTGIRELPESVGSLKELKVLNIKRSLISTGMLEMLREVYTESMRLILPREIEGLPV